MKITGYKLVFHRADYIEKEINELLQKGWQPLGAPGISPAPPHSDQSDVVYQAMVLYDDARIQAADQ
jgi:hypothetical protein